MEKKRKVILVTSLVIVIVLVGLVSYSYYPRRLTEYEVEKDDLSKHLIFYKDGEKLLSYSIVLQSYPFNNNQIPLFVATWHHDKTYLNSMKLTFKLPKCPIGIPYGDVYLETPRASPFPTIHFYKDTNQDSVIDIPDLGVQGMGTVRLELLIDDLHVEEDFVNITVGFNATLSEEGWLGVRYNLIGELKLSISLTNPIELSEL